MNIQFMNCECFGGRGLLGVPPLALQIAARVESPPGPLRETVMMFLLKQLK